MIDNSKPDLAAGIPLSELPDGKMLTGRVNGEDAILVRRGDEFFAIGALCSHYHGELAGGLLVDATVRCPLHHACFSLRTGVALHSPALDPIPCWRVERMGELILVREKLSLATPSTKRAADASKALTSVVIVGGGAAALAAAVTLRREGYENELTMVSSDDSAPYDRPNVSKDFLARSAPEEWMPLRSSDFYADNQIKLALDTSVVAVDPERKSATLQDGRQLPFDALLLATGSDPIKIDVPGATPQNLFYLRTLADGRRLLRASSSAQRALVLGTGFIGLEAAASLRSQGLEVHVVGHEALPMQRVLGPQLGRVLLDLHVSRGVHFHLGSTVVGIQDRSFQLSDGSRIEADFMIVGVGARARIGLAQQAGLAIDGGVVVDEYLQTGAPGVFAAGDIARYPAHFSGDRIRVEHWVLAQRQGETAARNMLGLREKFRTVPFFWTQQYDLAINYVGHAEQWDATSAEGDVMARRGAIRYLRAGRTLAVATISMDLESLKAERALETDPGM